MQLCFGINKPSVYTCQQPKTLYVPEFRKEIGQETTLKVILDRASNSVLQMKNTLSWSNTPSKRFCVISSKMQMLLPLILSPLSLSVCRSTCRGQSTFDSPEISTKKPAVIWMRVVCKNLLFPTTCKHCLLVMCFTHEVHEGVLPSM